MMGQKQIKKSLVLIFISLTVLLDMFYIPQIFIVLIYLRFLLESVQVDNSNMVFPFIKGKVPYFINKTEHHGKVCNMICLFSLCDELLLNHLYHEAIWFCRKNTHFSVIETQLQKILAFNSSRQTRLIVHQTSISQTDVWQVCTLPENMIQCDPTLCISLQPEDYGMREMWMSLLGQTT